MRGDRWSVTIPNGCEGGIYVLRLLSRDESWDTVSMAVHSVGGGVSAFATVVGATPTKSHIRLKQQRSLGGTHT